MLGLTASLPLAEVTTTGSGLAAHQQRLKAYSVEISRVSPDPSQPRRIHDQVAHEELTASVKQHGILQPLSVRLVPDEDRYIIIAGERRYRAAKAAGLESVPCWVQEPKNDHVLLQQVIENWQRADLHPLDLASSLAELRDSRKLTQKQIAELTGKSEAEVSKFLKLLTLHPTVLKDIQGDQSGVVGRRHLEAVSRLPAAEQPSVWSAVKKEKLSVEATEAIVKAKRNALSGKAVTTASRQFQFTAGDAKITVQFTKNAATMSDVREALVQVLSELPMDQ